MVVFPVLNFRTTIKILLLFILENSGHSSGSDYKRQHQKAAAKLGTNVPPFSRSRGSSEQPDDGTNSAVGSSSRSLSKNSQESSHNLSAGARPDLLENAIVLADYHPPREQKNVATSVSAIENIISEQNIEEAVEASNVTLQCGTPKRENPFHKPNL